MPSMADCFRPRDEMSGSSGSSFFASLFNRDAEIEGGSKNYFNMQARKLAQTFDVDNLEKNFGRFQGGDDIMSTEE